MKRFLYIFLAILAFVACSDSDDIGSGSGNNGGNNDGGGQTPPTQQQITLGTPSVDFTTEGGSNIITFTAPDAWTAEIVNSRADDWCWIEPTSGAAGNAKITVTTTANDTPDDRTASIVIKSGTLSKTINVSQKQANALTVTSSKFEVEAEGGEVTIEVKANVDFEYIIDDAAQEWISYEGTRAMKTSTLVFKVAENESEEKREGKIVIKGGEFNEVVTIYQAGSGPSIVISQNEYVVSSDGETISVEVSSNIDVTVEIPEDVDWISESTTRTTSTNTYYFDIQPNEGYDQRSADIKFTNKENNLSEIVSITQAQKDAIVLAKDSYTVDKDGGDIIIEVGHNIDFNIEISADWITQVETRAYETESLTFNVAKNTDYENREGTIVFKSQDGIHTQIVTIYQAQEDVIIISDSDIVVSDEGGNISFEIQANIEFTVSDPDVDWLHTVTTRGLTTHTLNYQVDANTSYNPREAKIIVTDTKNNKTETITITQAQKDAIVISKSTYYFGKEGGDLLFKIQTNADISVSISEEAQSWILHPSTRAMQVQSLYFEIVTCDGDEIREGIITLTAGSAEQNIKVIQNPLATTGTQIIYESSDGNIVTPTDPTKFGATIVSNEYKDGIGILTFDSNVTAIGENAFQNCTTLSRIDVPEGITSIGDYAFAGCTGLEYISLANTITSIGNYAFQDCTGEILIDCDIPDAEILNGSLIGTFEKSQFTKVVISDWATKIGNKAFYECSSITSITIPSSVTEIGSYAFSGCSSITSDIVIPSGVTKINDYTFSGCSSISSITIPSSVTEIGSYAFSGCSSITSDIVIPSGVTKINDYTFYDCSSITSIAIPSSVTEMGESAFENCGGELTVNCNIPDTRNYNDERIFYNSKFTKVTIGEGVTKIGNYAFYGCSSITSITIPSSVTVIGSYAFENCGGELTVNCNIPDGNSYYKYGIFDNSKFTKVTIGEGVTKIGNYAFYECSSITSITIPSSVTVIGSYAFYECSSITSITIPSSVTVIGSYAFYECSSITSITIPSSVTVIGSYAFENCGGELTVNCNIPDGNSYYIPDGNSYYNYKYGIFDNSKFTKVTIGEGVTKIGSYAFYECSSITSITIPSSVTEIGSYAFDGCSSITSDIVIPSGVTKINDYTFSGCSSITSITIPSSVTVISSSAFGNCGGELTVNCNIPDGNSYYKYGIFDNSKFTKVTIGEGVTKIGNYAFYECSSITSITIPSSVTEIGSNTFENCTGEVIINCNTSDTDKIFKNSKFSIVTFGDNVTHIGGKLFYNNEYIKAVKIGIGVTSIGKDAFYDCSYLHSVYCMPTTPPALEDKYVFNYNAEDRKFYVPKTSVSAYKAATNWSGYFDKIVGFQHDLGEDNGSLENPDNSDNDVEW